MVAAAAIAALGAALALAWRSETLASLGLVGAMLVPVPVALQDDSRRSARASPVSCSRPRRSWRSAATGAVCSSRRSRSPPPQAIALVADEHAHALPVAIAFWLATPPVRSGLRCATASRIYRRACWCSSAAFGGWSAGFLYDGRAQGIALLGVALAYGAALVGVCRRDRDVASVLWAIALTLAAVGAASLPPARR